jgi:hypothetical protein
LGAIYRKLAEKGQIARYHCGIDRFTLDRIKPYLRAELDKRIMASANLTLPTDGLTRQFTIGAGGGGIQSTRPAFCLTKLATRTPSPNCLGNPADT